ncbi:MAG: HflK protein [Omnitrophica WOR_2 bacterium GWF2_38_59]|nr:MAG: HflK protein [Omnitrophica WOR_2 bacterium GWA2_37_7]OGX26814.1 MAG: HflK protein [Omnitrophica WOR_2 bacterium GWF2_38_59]OGX49468.1 MAG: HflK protein [Omnitrophica WOR_2 bacterium RIFOXYA2_FULL_38_17]OGX54846.1 MAG: HflK protein [Omnitrophica WOR_2 bacterium RIFOXYA12_FULL_38_10]OGX55954.1 MAG: HflK protein [Omnitrophica WOR_2 bacterium RIFOXYB2_FULL_38_16]OGX57052.1 MAG: HflK protein [Omnitrophica WOR_2 bacterium RIFOXYC2_FULL_38_12]HBG62453.1 FtsH protease activity modulator HflK 
MHNDMNKKIPIIMVVMIALFFVATSFYSVEQDEVGVIRRFGKYNRTAQPGLNWKLPFNIEKLDKVKDKRVFKEEFGFRTMEAGINTKYSKKSFDEESLMLTGDLNVLDVSWIVQFTIKDPVALLFNVRGPLETVRDLSESVMRQVIGDHSVSEALTTMKNEINLEVQQKLQAALDLYGSGIHVNKLELQEVLPPKVVTASFNEVNEAEQEREKVINQSWEAYNKVIPQAKGQAEKTIREAEGYALERVKKAQGDAVKFLEIWNAYKNAKDVTRKRMYLEAMEEVLPKAGEIYIFEPGASNVLPLLKLNKGAE